MARKKIGNYDTARIHECAGIVEMAIVIQPILQIRPYLRIHSPLGIYADVPERYIPLAPTATSRDDYLGHAISQQRGTFTPHVSAISRKPFRASSRDAPLTSARTCNGKSRNEIPPRYSSELDRRTWNARGRDTGGIAIFRASGSSRLQFFHPERTASRG